MRGIPVIFGTRQDVFNSMYEDAQATKKRLVELLTARMIWAPVSLVETGEGLNDETHKTVVHEIKNLDTPDADSVEPSAEVWQYALVEDPNAWVFQLGFTVEEIEQLIAS